MLSLNSLRWWNDSALSILKRFRSLILVCALTVIGMMLMAQTNQGAGQSTFRVVLDAGHGGNDLGAVGHLAREKDIVLEVVKLIGEHLRKLDPQVEVIYTRTGDYFVPLHRRASIANDAGADLFVSIHCNFNPDKRLRGAETYVMGLHKTQENLQVARTENAVILAEGDQSEAYAAFDPESDESYILLHLLQSARMEQSIAFATQVQKHLDEIAGLHHRGIMQAGFMVLFLTAMPGVLIEIGYLSNEAEERFLMQKETQQEIAAALAKAIIDYRKDLFPAQELVVQHVSPEETLKHEVDTSIKEEEAYYRIWFYTSSKPVRKSTRWSQKLPDLRYFVTEQGYLYTAGKASSYQEAVRIQQEISKSGVVRKSLWARSRIILTRDEQVVTLRPEQY